MSKYTLDETDTTGYFLPEDSHFRLAKLQDYLDFLRQLAQPRTHDEEERNSGPQVSGMELAVCMEILAEQVEQVLDEVTWPATREVDAKRPQALDEDDAEEDAEEADDAVAAGAQDTMAEASDHPPQAGEAAGSHVEENEAGEANVVAAAKGTEAPAAPDALEDPLVFGITMDQLDTLNRLHDRLHAFGDLVFGVEQIDLAKGTLTMLGDAIFEVAGTASSLMRQVNCQTLPDALRSRTRVREEWGAYGAPVAPGLRFDTATPRLRPPPAATGWHLETTTRH